MRYLMLVLVAAAALMLPVTATARPSLDQVISLRHQTAGHRMWTWHFQDAAHVHRTPTRYFERHTQSIPALQWSAGMWKRRAAHAKRYLQQHRLPYTGDWATAVRIVQRVWPGTSTWLLSCSSKEGGHGGFVMNYQGSGAGGWMQYMSGTFWDNFHHAQAAASRVILPPGTAAWTSPLGQAFAAGYERVAYLAGRLTGWPWKGDPYCA